MLNSDYQRTLEYDNSNKRSTITKQHEISITNGKHMKREFLITMGCVAVGLALIQIAQAAQNAAVQSNCNLSTHKIINTGGPIEQVLCIKRSDPASRRYI
jgi:hypothetical protein